MKLGFFGYSCGCIAKRGFNMFTLNRYILFIVAFSIPGEFSTLNKRESFFPFGCKQFYIEIFVFPEVAENGLYPLKIQWEHAIIEEGDWIGIFEVDPRTNKVVLEPLQVISVNENNGSIVTEIYQKPMEPEELGYEGKCLNYYAGYFDKCHNIFAVTCLRIEPDWMWRLRNKIGRKKIKDIMIPGSEEASWNKETLEVLHYRIKLSAQNERILGQLIYGSRYLYLRVRYDPLERNKWWINQFIYKIATVERILKEIRTFIEHTNEIIILDFKEFIGFDSKIIHVKFISYLDKQIGDLVVQNKLKWDSTFNQVWQTKKRLILAYNQDQAREGSSIMWNTVEHRRYKGQSMVGLGKFLVRLYRGNLPKTVWAVIANTAPLTKDQDYEKLKDPRIIAEKLNFEVTKWFKQREWLEKSNIVCVNFLKSTGIVRAAIQWNSGECN